MKRINNKNKLELRRKLRVDQTPQEIILWSRLRAGKTGYKWKRQVGIGSYIADFYCASKKLVVEVDGSQHMDNHKYDREREAYFSAIKIKTLRFWNNEINKNLDGVLSIIYQEISTSP